MTVNISDLMAGYPDDTIELSDPGITTPERILALTLGTPMPEAAKAPRKLWRTVLIAAVLATVLIVAAVAAAAPNFYEAAFGDRGLPDIDPIPMENDKGVSFTIPGIEWAVADTETAKTLLGNYVVDIGETVTVGNFTVHLDSFVMDEHGAGVLAWSVKNPDGIPNYTEDERLTLTFESEEGLCEPSFVTTTGDQLISRHIRNQTLSSDTELYLTTYLGHFPSIFEEDEHIRIFFKELVLLDGQIVPANSTSIELPSFEAVPAMSFTDGEHTVRLTPLSLCMKDSYIPGAEDNWWDTDKSILYTNGGKYTLVREDSWTNSLAGSYCQHNSEGQGASGTVKIFNRLVDPANVAEIRIEAFQGGTLIFTPAEP